MANSNPQYPTKSQSSPIIQTSPKILKSTLKFETPNFKIRKATNSKSVKLFEMQIGNSRDDHDKDLKVTNEHKSRVNSLEIVN